MKTCTKCKETKNIDLFQNDKSKPSGKRPECKSCTAKAKKEYAAKNKEKIAQYQKDYKKKNQEYLSDYHKKYLNNGGREVRKTYRENNKDKIKELKRHNNALRKQAIKQGVSGSEYQVWLSEQPKICAYCGINCSEEFHVDHIEPLAAGGEHITTNFATSCPACNTSKGSQSLIIFLAKSASGKTTDRS